MVCIDVLGLALAFQPIIPPSVKSNTTSSADRVRVNFLSFRTLEEE
jgi:hypothetical protein